MKKSIKDEPFVFTECIDRKYGDSCLTDCGYCKDMVQCNHVDGACPNGCEAGYTQGNCTQRTATIHYELFVFGRIRQNEIFFYISLLFSCRANKQTKKTH